MIAASLIEPLSCAVHCHNIADVKESDNVVIIGAGPMGLIIESVIRKHPIKKLISIEIDQWRGQKALELGADHWINPNTQNVKTEIMKITNNKGADVIIDAVGISQTFELMSSSMQLVFLKPLKWLLKYGLMVLDWFVLGKTLVLKR
jgi:L-iditol 2-dehydrogenase